MEKFIKPVIPLWKVLLFSFGFLGVELVVMIFAISTPQFFGTFIQGTGLTPYLWLSVPMIGIFFQPLIGFVGDHLWGAYGRRGFFILLASSFGSISIFMLSVSQNAYLSLFFLLLILLSINTLIVSYRAMVTEMTPPQERIAGYGMLTALQLFGMLGAILIKHLVGGDGSAVPNLFGDYPPFVTALLIIGAIILLITAFFGTFFLKEYPNLGYRRYVSYVPFSSESEEEIVFEGKVSYLRQGAMWLSVTALTLLVFLSSDFFIEVYIIPFVMFSFAVLLIIAHRMNRSKYFLSVNEKRFVELMTDVMNMPLLMKKLNMVLLFAWFALYLFLANLPALIAQNSTFIGSIGGFSMLTASYIFFILIALISTPLLIIFARRETLGRWLSISILAMVFSQFIYYYYPSNLTFAHTLIVFGVLLSVMFTVPYAMLSYRLPSKRVGVFFGLFNLYMVVPYILVPSISNSFVKSMFGVHFQTVIMCAVALLFAFICSLMINKRDIKP